VTPASIYNAGMLGAAPLLISDFDLILFVLKYCAIGFAVLCLVTIGAAFFFSRD
jgi:hypothetical protein